jgi:putative GTP pyrophosphokinase
MTKGEINRIGERLRTGAADYNDLTAFNTFRASHIGALTTVVGRINLQFGPIATARMKRTLSVIEKLRRSGPRGIKLSQMQDIAGCRLTVTDIFDQEQHLVAITQMFERTKTIDRRTAPSHGYRAVHVLASIDGKPVEIQVRTLLQHLWAQYSERLADRLDPRLKYGIGPEKVQLEVMPRSELVAHFEAREVELCRELSKVKPVEVWGEQEPKGVDELRALLDQRRSEIKDELDQSFLKLASLPFEGRRS